MNIIGNQGIKISAGAEIRRFPDETVYLKLSENAEKRIENFGIMFEDLELLMESRKERIPLNEEEKNEDQTRDTLKIKEMQEGKKKQEVKLDRELSDWEYIFGKHKVRDAHEANFRRDLCISVHADTKEFVLFSVILPTLAGDIASQMSYLPRVTVDQSRMNNMFYSIIGVMSLFELLLIANIMEWIAFPLVEDWQFGWYAAFIIAFVLTFRHTMAERVFWGTYYCYGTTRDYPIKIFEKISRRLEVEKILHLKNATIHHLFLYYSAKVDPREVLSTKVERKTVEENLSLAERTIRLLEEKEIFETELKQLKNTLEATKMKNVELQDRVREERQVGYVEGLTDGKAPRWKSSPNSQAFPMDKAVYGLTVLGSVFIFVFLGIPAIMDWASTVDMPGYLVPAILGLLGAVFVLAILFTVIVLFRAITAKESRIQYA